MKTLIVNEKYGIDHLNLTPGQVPEPKADEVLVKVAAISLNYLDLMVIRGDFGHQIPHIPGSDAAGTVLRIGSAVTGFLPGDQVSTHFTPGWQSGNLTPEGLENRLGIDAAGVFSTYICLPETALVKSPVNLSAQESATLPIAALTAWEALHEAGGLKPGETVLLQGTGGVSVFALQFAKLAGARVIITSSSDEKLKRARSMGADHVFNYKTEPDWLEKVKALGGVDLALEVIGTGFKESIQACRFGGRIIIIGFLNGAETSLSIFDFLQKKLTVKGVLVGSKGAFSQMNETIEKAGLHPVIDKIFPFSEARKAFEYLAAGKHFGKIVLDLN
ncbi:NAD(P)-dependent alcohol dehydrogenase [Pedobacter sp. KBW06]|uniref:zinc-dependent alcohol dehydrogenase family protein n=1 Tax=Pedobacter sp. KBW06 TaxID=2153359 RepID=UPI000F591487|nr:NAD(P)-dependent alcohol dehydrogenase [Pedobacter sp. KBW06]RQO70025.1 NAD(P)-dependent alcohol dehydrogenase [Pedobacter sp. KBW06]